MYSESIIVYLIVRIGIFAFQFFAFDISGKTDKSSHTDFICVEEQDWTSKYKEKFLYVASC